MNPNAISEIELYGRFRIPFPDTSYTLHERRNATAALNANANASVEAADNDNDSDSDNDSAQSDAPTLVPRAELPEFPAVPVEDRRSLRCFVAAHVVASIENLCASELVPYIDSAAESVVGSEILLKHTHAAAVGSMVAVSGHVSKVEERSVTFEVTAKVDGLAVAEGQLRFVIVERGRFAAPPIESIVERGLSMIQPANSHVPDVRPPNPVLARPKTQSVSG